MLSLGNVVQMGREEMEIVFLGTGAAIPSKYRNVTGIYLNFFGRGGMLLDCGEGSYGQLRRRFVSIPERLRCVMSRSTVLGMSEFGLSWSCSSKPKFKACPGTKLFACIIH